MTDFSNISVFDEDYNYKGLLLEYCVKHGNDLSFGHRTKGPQHKLIWNVSCSLMNKNDTLFTGKTDTEFNSKKNGEQYACFLIILFLKKPRESRVQHTQQVVQVQQIVKEEPATWIGISHMFDINYLSKIIDNTGHIYLIDLENLQHNSVTLDIMSKNKNTILIGFMGRLHQDKSKYSSWTIIDTETTQVMKQPLFIYTINGGYKDMADHYISFFIYPLCLWMKRTLFAGKITIVTKDSAGFCSQILLNTIINSFEIPVKTNLLSVEINL